MTFLSSMPGAASRPIRVWVSVCLVSLGLNASAEGQEAGAPPAQRTTPAAKVATARRVAARAIRVDGRLDEPDWLKVPLYPTWSKRSP